MFGVQDPITTPNGRNFKRNSSPISHPIPPKPTTKKPQKNA
jgi:hypothetical protein